ncbi:MAG: tyrosine--tRNA ligase [Phycisphaerae bacterium]|jgi:tyrosyl-tRNA synthetase|nr:tyrosine--tRNA ligase [Phycisphaerae bacterium]
MLSDIDMNVLARTMEDIFSLDEFRKKLATGKPLRIKYGVDATASFLHIGHAVNLWMMRYLQEHGHVVVFLLGDFTTRIGDPTGRSGTRQIISRDEIEENAQAFLKQVGTILLTDSDVLEVRRNSEWFDKMGVDEFLSLLSMVTHQRLIQRDMFRKRIEFEQEIYMHEMLYPILQGYDSVMLESDLTIVGTDQLFNELMGRFYQERFGQNPQIVMTTKITPGTDGKEKQSKSLGNFIALADSPRDKFGKAMSIPDDLIIPYLEVYTTVDIDEIREISQALDGGSINPMTPKIRLAEKIVSRYHGDAVAIAEREWFTQTFSQKQTPEDIPQVSVGSGLDTVSLLRQCLPNESKSALRRLLQQGGIRINGHKLSSSDEQIAYKTDDVLRAGKRQWFKLSVN